ncbi:hypothetical protein [Vogesella oryzae]|uniref:hypothetical protein n=1 Tax=Vogesella oryzae TaxID=1735285 RepID=UPI001583D27D|nr:hypothetical protein [Vogesella oryzae]
MKSEGSSGQKRRQYAWYLHTLLACSFTVGKEFTISQRCDAFMLQLHSATASSGAACSRAATPQSSKIVTTFLQLIRIAD